MNSDVLVDLAFPANYGIERLKELQPDDELQRVFFPGATREGGGDGLTVAVSTAGNRWVGTFAFGGHVPDGLSRIFALPDPDSFCVIAQGAGYIARASNPDAWESLEIFPILSARAFTDHRLLVFSDFTTIAAYGPRGLAWRTDRLSWDGVKIIAAEGDNLWARVWDAPGNQEATVTVNLQTGAHRGGAAPPPSAEDPLGTS